MYFCIFYTGDPIEDPKRRPILNKVHWPCRWSKTNACESGLVLVLLSKIRHLQMTLYVLVECIRTTAVKELQMMMKMLCRHRWAHARNQQWR